MTDRQAQAHALRWLGTDGRAWHPPGECRGGPSWCLVGVTGGYPDCRRWTVCGLGPTWEEAFADAVERKK